MKTVIKVSIIFTTFLFASCGNSSTKKAKDIVTEPVETAMYQCPMKCEDEKMYEEQGTCPVCKMDLELVSKENEHKHHNH